MPRKRNFNICEGNIGAPCTFLLIQSRDGICFCFWLSFWFFKRER